MSQADRSIDLEALARPADSANVPEPRRRWLWILLPVLLLLGFLAVFYDAARDYFTDAVLVTVVRPQAATSSGPAAGAVVFQTAGWIEPDPYPISVTALAPGVVARMLVEESDEVKVGDPVCELVDDDARIAVDNALAARAKAQADAADARVELRNAEAAFAAAIEVTRALDSAVADHAAKIAALEQKKAAAFEVEASVRVAEADLETQKFLKEQDAVGPWQVELAQARYDEAKAKLDATRAAAARAKAELAHAAAVKVAAERDHELRLAESLRVDRAKVAVERADAAVKLADAVLADAQLRKKRMVVVAPTGGVVLTRDAQPGSTVGPNSAPVCTLYDPSRLRVRVDVPQSQVAGASRGQRAEIQCDIRRGRPYAGKVIRIIDAADIAKVTLEVQVRVEDPDGLLKPDMLCTVAAYADPGSEPTKDETVTAVRIPARCLVGPNEVWVVDAATGRASKRRIETGRRDGSDVIVTRGLNVTDKVIDRGAAGLTEGARIQREDDR